MPSISAAADFALFTAAPSNADPTMGVAQVMLELANGQAKLIKTMKNHVAGLTNSLDELNDLLGKVANAKTRPGLSEEVAGFLATSATFTRTTPPGPDQLAARQSMIDLVNSMVHYGGTTALTYTARESQFAPALGVFIDLDPDVDAAGKSHYRAYAVKSALDSLNANLQRAADQVSAEAQQAQLDLQTMMGRYNGAFEVVTAGVKKSEARAQAVVTNVRR
ncbi:MAG: hypothetical protein EOO28_16355 [Comamonadaceae bacterium]|nr:MAG: hypothetical protein EOO28_16355 [Comamonadaceae bacterium]